MSDLVYASVVILIIWAGIFLWVFGLDRRLRRLERAVTGRSTSEKQPEPESDESGNE